MIRSMTAFARAGTNSRSGHWAVEIRSLNHRYFEFSVKLPPALAAIEGRVRDRVQAEMKRGKITVSINQDFAEDRAKSLGIDEAAVEFYLTKVKQLKKRFKLAGELSISDLLKMPGIFSTPESDEDPEKNWAEIRKVLDEALIKAVKAKQLEGKKLGKDVQERIDQIAEVVRRIEKAAQGQSARIMTRLQQRVSALLAETEKDAERIHREVAFLAERSDITEEIIRMKSHLDLFSSRLKGDGEVGRELDFLCQEMNREVNTMASKAQHFEISTDVVFIKGELEKIREQIQNIE